MALSHCVVVGLQSIIVVFPDHNHMIILETTDNLQTARVWLCRYNLQFRPCIYFGTDIVKGLKRFYFCKTQTV